MAAHKDFVKLLADIEIYVDGIASMQIQSLSAIINVARENIIQQYKADENDPHMRILHAAHIDEDEYFRQIAHDDLDGIIKDIKDAHITDSSNTPEITPLQQFQEAVATVSSIKGSATEKQLVFFCKQLGIDYTKLTDIEFKTMMKVLEKSKYLRGHGRGRGKKR